MDNLKRTSLYESHIKHGGKMIDFTGWELPVQFQGLIQEHEAVRNAAGLFDISHMGEIDLIGEGAKALVQKLITNDASVLNNNQVLYTMMCYPDGGVVDDLLVYKHCDQHFLLVVNSSNIQKDFDWMVENSKGLDVKIVNNSGSISGLALQGPKAQEILQRLTDTDLNDIKFFYFLKDVNVSGVSCLVSRTGYTGEDGFEIYVQNENAPVIWEAILESGKAEGLLPCGLGSRDTLRFEASLPLYGNEISKDISPLEAGLGFFVKLATDDFIGKEALVQQKEQGLKRKIVGFEMKDRGIPRQGYEVMADGKVIGFVTTGYFSPTLKKNIGFAMVDMEYSKLGSQIQIVIRNKPAAAEVVDRRFYKKNYNK